MKEKQQTSRREFLKTCVAGTVVLGASEGLAFAEKAQEVITARKSKVVIATDASLRTGSGVDPKRALALLDRAMKAYFSTRNPVDPWKKLVRPGQVVGLKVNTIAGPGLSTNRELVAAIAERLQQAGIKPYDIVIWDRTNRELQRAGFQLSSELNKVRCIGTDAPGVGYEDASESFGSVNCRVSKLLTQTCDVVINVPLLKDHGMAGVTLSLKNMYGVINNPQQCHSNNCNPGVADVAMLPSIRKKVVFTIADATTCCYEGGPRFNPQYAWEHNSIIVGHDPVAVDYTGWQIIDRKRVENGLKTLEAVGRGPKYIAVAADTNHRLGTNDPKHISLVQA
ncbi:MAG TPA: DUF362 domain-containing protein [Terriglobales bacterium]|nr:DUF362 domain-containing protein [Terriglobales bacterium]